MKRIIIIGKGHLGSILNDELQADGEILHCNEILHWKKDIAELDARTIHDFSPDLVINSAGKTDLPWCEENQTECWRCNVIEPVMLQRRLPRTVSLMHMSSGCIWTGPFNQEGQPFGPYDPPTPACFYSWTKSASDAMLYEEARLQGRNLLILRPRQVFSHSKSPRNTLTKLSSYKSLIDTPNSMTSAKTIVATIRAMIGNVGQQIMCVYNPGITSPFDVGMKLFRAGLREEPQIMDKKSMDGWHKPRRIDAVLRDEFFESIVAPPRIGDALDEAILEYKEAQG